MFQYDKYIYVLHNEQMATVRLQNDMTVLLQFLESDDYTNGHPNEPELIAAINDINNNIRVKQAFDVLKTARVTRSSPMSLGMNGSLWMANTQTNITEVCVGHGNM
jgi:hypothetical protein